MADIRLITFDLDNTLWDTGQVIRHAEAQMNAWLDSAVPEYRQRMDRTSVLALREQVVTERPETGHDVSALRAEILYRGMLLCDFNEAEARAQADTAFDVFFEARQQVEFFEHALDSLDQLAGRYQLAALTNGNAHVEKIGLDRYFSFAFSSADVSASKPAPDIFHAALERAGVRADESIHVGDHLVDDIHGAGSVGMHTIWVKHPNQEQTIAHTQPSQAIDSLQELPDAVRRIHSD